MNPIKHFIKKDISKDRSIDDNHKATEKSKKKYNYRYTGASVAYGPIYADTPIEAKKQIGKVKGLEVWETR
jgi:hypothetical protein